MGQKVVTLDPFRMLAANKGGTPQGFNPLAVLNPASPEAVDDAQSLADLMVVPTNRTDPFWDDRARDLLAASLLFVAAHARGSDRSVATVKRMWGSSGDTLATLVAAMKASPAGDGLVSAAAQQIINTPDKTRGSIMASMFANIEFLGSPAVRESVTTNSIQESDLRTGAPMTVYLILPPHRLRSHARLLRLWLGAIIMAMSRRRSAPRIPTMLMVDETAQLGRMDSLLTAATLLRSYGVRTWTFWQSLAQIESIYGTDAGTFVDNAGVLSAFGVANAATERAIRQVTGWDGPLLGLPKDHQVIAMQGHHPHMARRINYLTDARYAGLYAENPFHRAAQPHPEPHLGHQAAAEEAAR